MSHRGWVDHLFIPLTCGSSRPGSVSHRRCSTTHKPALISRTALASSVPHLRDHVSHPDCARSVRDGSCYPLCSGSGKTNRSVNSRLCPCRVVVPPLAATEADLLSCRRAVMASPGSRSVSAPGSCSLQVHGHLPVHPLVACGASKFHHTAWRTIRAVSLSRPIHVLHAAHALDLVRAAGERVPHQGLSIRRSQSLARPWEGAEKVRSPEFA